MSTVGSVTRATCKMWRTVKRIFLCPGIFAFDGRASFVCVFAGPLSMPWAAVRPASLTVASIVFCNIYEM
ncbi:hypothetical protein F5148DRAFT_1235927 [Russula earlei]|uniref:Uncharacterized protein n=1 Tax=Russula earlei TaxID=71964 RepID=A0ACC0TZ23_9AGAM|nr:hypothetical protein F5148DRAFT_1235927 [Russula earlei]